MAKLLICLGLFFLITPITPADVHERCQFGIDASKQASKAVVDLALKLYKKLNKPEENLVFSPVSIALGLALVESGTSGSTRTELQNHLAPPGSNQADSSTLYESLQHQLRIKGGEKVSLNIANGLFYSESLTVKPEFINHTIKCFDTQVDKAPFRTDADAARRQINQWVSEKTSQKITELLKATDIDPTTVAVLANALHLKAAWTNRFERTENLPFYKFGRDNQAQTVPFLVQERTYNYAENDKVQAVEIPYEGVSALSFYILLPKQRGGLQSFESDLNKEQLKALGASAAPKVVNLKFPKFTVRSTSDLKTVLQQLGVEKIFSDQADFSRLATGQLKISKVVHEAFIKVNENGTEATAATASVILPGAPAPPVSPPVAFVADHPFIFSIVHKPTKAVIFLGKVTKVEE
jgi:serpin B